MKLFSVVALVAIFGIGCVSYAPPRDPIAVDPLQLSGNEARVVDQVLVVTDASGSMKDSRSFSEAKALTQEFISALPEANVRSKNAATYSAGAIAFGGDDRKTTPLATFDRGALASDAENLHLLGVPHPRTPLNDVLAEAHATLDGQGPAALVLFSDGQPDSEATAMQAGRELVASIPAGICIHTVHTAAGGEGKAFLTGLSQLTSCGSVRTAADLQSASNLNGFSRDVLVAAIPGTLPAVGAIDPCTTPVRLRAVEFNFDKANLTDSGEQTLSAIVSRLGECEDVKITIRGHTDGLGTDAYNEGLSERRATTVENFLSSGGIDSGRLNTEAKGESEPIASNDTGEGRARNRRVELIPEK